MLWFFVVWGFFVVCLGLLVELIGIFSFFGFVWFFGGGWLVLVFVEFFVLFPWTFVWLVDCFGVFLLGLVFFSFLCRK